jgi:hypothetical protein
MLKKTSVFIFKHKENLFYRFIEFSAYQNPLICKKLVFYKKNKKIMDKIEELAI